jgi:hypothetical protein
MRGREKERQHDTINKRKEEKNAEGKKIKKETVQIQIPIPTTLRR